MRATIYARYSSENQRDTSIEDQVRRCTGYAQQRGWQVAHVHEDRAVSGVTMQRPGYQALMREVRKRAVDVVIVDDLSRLSRDTAKAMRALIDLLYHDIDGSRAALTTLLDQVVIHPCGPGTELELIGTLGRVLRPWFPDEILFLLEAEKETVPVQVTPSGTVDNGDSGGRI